MSITVQPGDIFVFDLASAFLEAFHPGYAGTPEYAEFPLTYGAIEWVGDGEVPGSGSYDGYDWKIAPFERITTDNGMLTLRVSEVNETECWVEGTVDGWYGLPSVRLTFDEFARYARM